MSKAMLIVDDEKTIRESLCRVFKAQGFSTFEAADGIEALSFLENTRVDIIISDIMMPRMNGVELLGEVRKQYPMIRVIMITGQVRLENALACMRRGADDCIFKPITDIGELTESVKRSYERLERWCRKLEALSASGKKSADGE